MFRVGQLQTPVRTLGLTCVGIAAFLGLLFVAVWLESRVRLGDFLLMVGAAVVALVVWVLVYQILTP